MELTCIPSDGTPPDRNFIEVKPAHRGHSEGAPLSARDLSEKLVVLLHDHARNRGCMAPCTEPAPVFDTIAAMRHYMVNHWGSRPEDVEVLLAGGRATGAEFNHALRAHLRRLRLDRAIHDARTNPGRPLGAIPRGAPAAHLFYYPGSAQVELVAAEEPGGRAYQSGHAQVTQLGAL